MLVAIYADFTAFFLVNDAVGIDLGDRFCPSFDGAVKGDDDREFGVNKTNGKDLVGRNILLLVWNSSFCQKKYQKSLKIMR